MCGVLVFQVLPRIAVLPAFKLSTCVYIAEGLLLQQAFWLCRPLSAESVVMDLFYLTFTRYVFVFAHTCVCVVCVCLCVYLRVKVCLERIAPMMMTVHMGRSSGMDMVREGHLH